ncbi:MAG: hypothetical protein M1826_007646 [Phylliscum demangeonii]|nr:MAG: hypothetical protein M1826_007646 [Phylliscum demangeonii]
MLFAHLTRAADIEARDGRETETAASPSPSDERYRRLATSWLLGPTALCMLRACFSLYAFVVIFVILGWQHQHGEREANGQSFSYFTVLTYWGLAFYFLFAAVHSFSVARYGQAWLERWPRPLQTLHSLWYTTIVTFPILVTVVYWALIYRGTGFLSAFDTWSNVSQHALNTVFALVEILIPATAPPPILHLLGLVGLLTLYLALAYLTHATQHFYPYSFLDPAEHGPGRVVLYVFGILVAISLIFAVVWLLISARRWVTERAGWRTGRRAFPIDPLSESGGALAAEKEKHTRSPDSSAESTPRLAP